MKKRLSALLLALAMVFSLSSCRSQAEKQAMKDSLDELNGYSSADYSLPTGTKIDRTVLYNKDGFKLTAVGVSMLADGALLLTLIAENSTKNDLSLNYDYVTVNGWSVDALINCSVAAGSAAKGTLEVEADELTQLGYTDLDTLSFHLYAYDENSYDTVADLGEQSVSTGVSSAANGPDLSGAVQLYSGKGITVSCLNTGVWNGYTCEVDLYLENTSSKVISLNNQDNVTVNGSTEVEGWVYETVPPNCKRIGSITLYCSDLEEAGIGAGDVAALTTYLQLFDYNTYSVIADLGDVTVNVAGAIQDNEDADAAESDGSDSSSLPSDGSDSSSVPSDGSYGSLPQQEPEQPVTTGSSSAAV